MEPALQILLELQHIDQRLKELEDPAEARQMKKLGFTLDPEKKAHLSELRKKRADQLEPEVVAHYQGLKERYGQAVVPVDGGICLGCFMTIPTSWLQRVREAINVRTCGHCGRILYWVDP